MKVLVIGASGLVGWNCWQIFRQHGWEVIGTSGQHWQPGLIPLDLADEKAAEELLRRERPAAVINCAAWSWVDGCEGNPARAFAMNSHLPGQLATFAERNGARFVHFSSSYVFDGQNGPYRETDAPHPISVYGESKRAGEIAVAEATDGRALIVRTMGVYGEEPQRKNFVYQVIDKLSRGERMKVPNDQYGNATHAADLAIGLLRLLEQGRFGIWNLAGPEPRLRRDEFALRIAAAYDLSADLFDFVSTAALQQPAARPREGGLIVQNAVAQLDWHPRAWQKVEL